ncbi:hypothetical protein [Vibrio sp. 10N.222.49.B4]|uniref:hypothetical protein n=1 Tax=Vibrio sp. 10N.222.49.B4 TaxID=3229613 RepID=UPI00354E5384
MPTISAIHQPMNSTAIKKSNHAESTQSIVKSVHASSAKQTSIGSSVASPTTGKSHFNHAYTSPKGTQEFYSQNKMSFSQKLENFLSEYLISKPGSEKKRVKELSNIANVTVSKDFNVTCPLPSKVGGFKQLLSDITKGHSPTKGEFYPKFKALVQQSFSEIISLAPKKGHKDTIELKSPSVVSPLVDRPVSDTNVTSKTAPTSLGVTSEPSLETSKGSISSSEKTTIEKSKQADNQKNATKEQVTDVKLQNYYEHESTSIKKEFESLFNAYASSSTKHAEYAQSYSYDWSMTYSNGCYQLESLPKMAEEFASKFCKLTEEHSPNGSLGKLVKKALTNKTTLGQMLRLNKASTLGPMSQLLPTTLKVVLKSNLSTETAATFQKVVKQEVSEQEQLNALKQKQLPSQLQKLELQTNLYQSNVKEFPEADLKCRNFQKALVKAVNRTNSVDKNNELQRKTEFRGQGTVFKELSPSIDLPVNDQSKHTLFDTNKTYGIGDFDNIVSSNFVIKEKTDSFENHLSRLNQNIGFHIEKLPNEAEVANVNTLGINPLNIDVDRMMAKLTNLKPLLLEPKPSWRSRLIQLFHPKGAENEAERLSYQYMDISHLQALKDDISTSSEAMKLTDLSNKPWMQYLVAKQVESLKSDCQSYKLGLFTIASPAKKQLDALLSSNEWLQSKA